MPLPRTRARIEKSVDAILPFALDGNLVPPSNNIPLLEVTDDTDLFQRRFTNYPSIAELVFDDFAMFETPEDFRYGLSYYLQSIYRHYHRDVPAKELLWLQETVNHESQHVHAAEKIGGTACRYVMRASHRRQGPVLAPGSITEYAEQPLVMTVASVHAYPSELSGDDRMFTRLYLDTADIRKVASIITDYNNETGAHLPLPLSATR